MDDFKSVLGAVTLLSYCRPDIALTIAKDSEAVIHLLHYLWSTRDKDAASGYGDCSFACHENVKRNFIVRRLCPPSFFSFKSFMAPTVDLSSCQDKIGATVE